jgi:hypothetical protein
VEQLTLGRESGDGHANAESGSRFCAEQAYRAAELFTNDACVDLKTRI